MRINPSCIQPLPLNTPLLVDGVHVTLIDANHCPGSVLFLFKTTAPRGSEYPDQVLVPHHDCDSADLLNTSVPSLCNKLRLLLIIHTCSCVCVQATCNEKWNAVHYKIIVDSLHLGEASQCMQVILHTGDMRWHARIGRHPALANQRIDMLFLDTTYASPKYVFPCQASANKGIGNLPVLAAAGSVQAAMPCAAITIGRPPKSTVAACMN